MKRCTFCGGMISDAAKFCEHCGAPVGKRKFLSKEHYLSWREMRDELRTKEQKAEERAVEEQRVQMNTIPVKDHGSEEQQRGLNEEEERKYIRENWVIRLFMIILLITGVFLVNQTASESDAICGYFLLIITALVTGVARIELDGFKGAQRSKKSKSRKKTTIALITGIVAIVVFYSAWRLSPIRRFDQNLFENIPLTSAEEITTWLDDNGYEYEEFGERGGYSWIVKFRSKQGNNEVSIADRHNHFTLDYRYDAPMRTYLKFMMRVSHSLVSSDEYRSKYKDGENVYYVFDSSIYRMYYGVTD